MKRVLLAGSLFVLISNVKAQNKKYQIQVGVEAGYYKKNRQESYGGYGRGMYLINKNGQLTLTSRWMSFETKGNVSSTLAGYRLNVKRFNLEPQVGYARISKKLTIQDKTIRQSRGAVGLALGAGYTIKRFELGLRQHFVSTLNSSEISSTNVFLAFRVF